jgi:hypothetical protein
MPVKKSLAFSFKSFFQEEPVKLHAAPAQK